MADTTASVYAAGWRALYRILADVELPSDIETLPGLGPDGQQNEGVHFAGFANGEEPREYLFLPGIVREGGLDMELTFDQPILQEEIPFVIGVQTARHGKTQWEALDRLETLTALVENAIDAYDTIDSAPAEFAEFRALWLRSGTFGRSITYNPDTGGYVGHADVVLVVKATRR